VKCATRTVNGLVILDIEGEVDLHTSPDLRHQLQDLAKTRCPALLLNLAKTEYMDSSGLATLIEYFQGARGFGGKMALCGLSARIRNLFEVARLEQIFTLHPDEPTAVAAMAS
jgi:anti-sigma B factor antagonist